MRYELGTVSINNLPQLYNARTNLYTLINRVGNNPVLAASVSAGLSQASRKLLQKGLPFILNVDLDTNEAGSATLTFELSTQSGHDESIFTSTLFTSVRAPQISGKKYRQKASLRLPLHLALTENTLSELRTQLQMKGRDELISEVRSKNAELQESLENLKRTRSAKERMESELNIGRDIQMGMLPLNFPAFPGRKEIDVYALLNPAREVGGDFYDFFFVDENHLCFCAGDVSGKGVPAALFMAMTKTLIKSRAADDSSTASIITHVNDELSEDNQASMFVTVFICLLNVATGKLMYTNAGHNPPYVKRSDRSLEKLDILHGPAVGAFGGMTYSEEIMQLNENDVVVIYTDGVTEAMNVEGELYSDQRLLDLLKDQPDLSVREVTSLIADDVRIFEEGADQADDVTVLAVQYMGGLENGSSKSVELVLVNKLSELQRIMDEFGAHAKLHNVPDTYVNKFNIVFDELLNNIISYAYSDEDEHEILVRLSFAEDRIAVTIEDDGRPFNPLGLVSPDTSLSIEERQIGGLGIHLVKEMVNEIEYSRKIDRNVLSMLMLID